MSAAAPVAHTWCSQCGYCLDGLPDSSRVCPECGGEREVVEMAVPREHYQRQRLRALIGSVLMAGLLTFAAHRFVSPRWGVAGRFSAYQEWWADSNYLWSFSSSFEGYIVGTDGPVLVAFQDEAHFRLVLPSGGSVQISCDRNRRTYSYRGAKGQWVTEKAFDLGMLERLANEFRDEFRVEPDPPKLATRYSDLATFERPVPNVPVESSGPQWAAHVYQTIGNLDPLLDARPAPESSIDRFVTRWVRMRANRGSVTPVTYAFDCVAFVCSCLLIWRLESRRLRRRYPRFPFGQRLAT